MNSSPNFDYESFAQRHRGGMLLVRHGLDLYPHPFLGFTLAPDHRSSVLNTDSEGFRLSDSPFGTVDTADWLAAGGGGLLLGNSVAVALAATRDGATPASHLAYLTGSRWLNLGLCAAVSLQELVASVPFLHAASTVVIIGGGPDFVNLVGSLTPNGSYGTVSYERTFAELTQVPLFDLATLACGKTPIDMEARRVRRETSGSWDPGDVARRMETAVRRRLRDLGVLARAAGERTRILMCLQPLATSRTRDITPEEQERFDFAAPVFGILHRAIEEHWDLYAHRLAEGCAELGVSFLNMSADLFKGDSFADTVHLTDEGNRQAAQMIHEALEEKRFISKGGHVSQATTHTERVRQLRGILVDALQIDVEELTDTSDFVNDHGADSMTAIDIVSRIEMEMDVEIPMEMLPEMTNFTTVLELVNRYAKESGPGA